MYRIYSINPKHCDLKCLVLRDGKGELFYGPTSFPSQQNGYASVNDRGEIVPLLEEKEEKEKKTNGDREGKRDRLRPCELSMTVTPK